jgi:hypothetical protein
MLCPHCNADIPDGNRYCTECGQSMTVETETLPPLVDVPKNLSSGTVKPGSLGLLLLCSVAGGIIVGMIYYFIAQFFELIILFPIGAGFCLGFVLAFMITKLKVRKVALVVLITLVGGILVYGTKLFMESQKFRAQFIEYVQSDSEGGAEAAQFAGDILSPFDAFRLYIQMAAEQGIEISRAGREGGIPITGAFFYLLLLVELGLLSWVAIGMSAGAAREPFCEECDGWMGDAELIKAHPADAPALLELIRKQDWQAVSAFNFTKQPDEKNHAAVKIERCGTCLKTNLIFEATVKGRTKRELYARLAPESVARLTRLGETQPETSAAAE